MFFFANRVKTIVKTIIVITKKKWAEKLAVSVIYCSRRNKP